MEKGSGLLVHISSLPSKHGIGTFGKEAHAFVKFLADAKQKYWQVLPLNPTSYGDSPYQSFSAFALNPYFIDLDILVTQGLLTKKEVKAVKGGTNPRYCDFGIIYEERFNVLKIAFKRGYSSLEEEIQKFYHKQKYWLEDYACFMLLKGLHNGKSFQDWKRDYRLHKKTPIGKAKEAHIDEYRFWIFVQYIAYEQYMKLKKHANRRGIKIIGDMPIYVSLDSSDVWAHPKLFKLDQNRRPTEVAGVPPDFFSETGQLWGNPIYDWKKNKETKFFWWRKRVQAMAKLFDAVRIDHFRGFEAYWSVPFGEKTAINGTWVKGPGYDLFEALKPVTKKCQIIAEDLGVITPEVKALKAKCGFPGMKLYQFAFGDYERHLKGVYYDDDPNEAVGPDFTHCVTPRQFKEAKLLNPFLPHNYEENCIAYIGTHDNDVMVNFINEHPELKEAMKDYLCIWRDEDILDTMIGSLMRSKANVVIFSPQDLLHMDRYSRMNTPGVASGNWQYRFLKEDFSPTLANHLSVMVEESGRK
jgi:4-alpha-glucanotransferase